MGQYRNGYFTSAAAAVTLELGFVPDKVSIINYTKTTAGSGVGDSLWINGVIASGKAFIDTYTGGAPVRTLLASNGVTPFSTGADWAATQADITGVSNANPCVVTAVAHGYATGDTVTISNVLGTTQLNTNRYIITVLTNDTFSLSDLFGNPVDSTAFGTYVSGGQANKISTDETPPGDQFDEGSAGVILGTGVVGSASDVIFWEAWFETPTGW